MARSPNQPRISVNDLALFMVSSDTARMGIIRRAAEPRPPVVTRYKDVRPPIKAYLCDPARRVNPLSEAERMFEQRARDTAESALRQDDARQSIEALHAVQALANQLGGFSFVEAPNEQPKLMISGVAVSVRADLWVRGATRGVEQIGGAVLRLTQDDADTDSAAERRRNMGLYVATMVRMHVEQNNPTGAQPTNRLCMSIDARHGQVFVAPNSAARRISDIEAACRIIAALWGRA